ncbi:MAG TPA: DNA polymerase III subunit gamma/tau, partial [Methylomicrobium sp.]|nr:DNA polymerase III subunit gamma/tau [Methylomicrobium sp.]
MTYQVLARKWRPHNFSEIVGQEHVVKSLINALQHDRLHHAYLFTGTRGVGKTTLARILAKAINCENLQENNPCGACQVCRDVDEGRFLDLIEVDAASRTKVEDTRDLLDNAQYAPNQGRFKVYLIDEVHMLSGHSFNALLKTLEEPPAHVKFLLATTDPHKIPVTVLSRCLQFNLKRLSQEQIFGQMEFILNQETIPFEAAALKLLARAADGSMRDGLSLLDQAIVHGNGKVTTEDVGAMLGVIAQQPIGDLLHALAAQDAPGILQIIAELADLSPDFSGVLRQLLQALHAIAVLQQAPVNIDAGLDSELIAALAAKLPPEDVQLYYQIGLLGQKDLDLAPDPRTGFEMALLR